MIKSENFLRTYSYDKKSSHIIEKLEAQLQQALESRKKQVEEELQEKIRLEQEEAKKKIEQIENALAVDHGTLTDYKNIISQFEADKESVKEEIMQHIEVSMQLQAEIDEVIRMSLKEFEIVRELSQDFEEINEVFGSKLNSLRSTLKDKYDILIQVPDSKGVDDVDLNFEKELAKLYEIKKLLNGSEKADSET